MLPCQKLERHTSSCKCYYAAKDLLEFPTLNPLLQQGPRFGGNLLLLHIACFAELRLQHGEPSGPRDNEKVQKATLGWVCDV